MSNPTKVLIIEDDAAIRRSLSARLEDSGYQTLEAAGGREGLEIFAREHPDVVITDLRMSDMDGFAAISNVKSQSPHTPIVVVSGTGDASLMEEALARGAHEYLRKPIADLSELEVAIARAIMKAKR